MGVRGVMGARGVVGVEVAGPGHAESVFREMSFSGSIPNTKVESLTDLEVSASLSDSYYW